MIWTDLTRWILPAIVVVGTSALTLAIVALPDLGIGVLAAIVGARVLMGMSRLAYFLRLTTWWIPQHKPPHLAGAA
jgi:hypothetical protein